MKSIRCMMFCLVAVLSLSGTAWCEPGAAAVPNEASPGLDTVLDNLEKTYLDSGFWAEFVQTSTLKAMDISDTATGKIFVKPPGMMRWEYETPDPQLIISDGKQLWVYRPEDNQVMVGKSPAFFGDGKGAGFLSDIRQIREQFDITLEAPENPDEYLLRAVPRKKSLDLAEIYLFVSKSDYLLTRVITRNSYDDETRLDFINIRLDLEMGDDMFTFIISDDMDVLKLDE